MAARFCLLLLALAALAPGEEAPWPDSFRGRPAKVVPLDAGNPGDLKWQTARFRFLADDPVPPASLQKFATVIESVPELLQALPLEFWSPAKSSEKPAIILCRDEAAFHEAGGGIGGMGYYDGRRNVVIIRADVFLAPPHASPSRLIPKPNEDLLVHELVHLGMHGILIRSKPWFYEGIAEYISAAHAGGGRYEFHDIKRSIRDHIRNSLVPVNDGPIILPAPGPLMELGGKQWMVAMQQAGDYEAFLPYATSLLLVHYQLAGRDRRAQIANYLAELAAHKDFRRPVPTLKTDDPDTIAKRIAAYWKSRGLNIQFSP